MTTQRSYPTGISRIEHEQTWLARVFHYNADGKRTGITAKRFLDRAHTNREQAYTAACAWVKANQMPRPKIPIGVRLRSGHSKNSTGHVGITHTIHQAGSGAEVYYDVYQVSYRKNGRAATKGFYWQKYPTPHDALQAAIAFRRQFEQEYIEHHQRTQLSTVYADT